MSHRRYDVMLLAAVLIGALTWWLVVRTPAGIIVQEPIVDSRATPYRLAFDQRQGKRISPPKYSPDSRWIIVDSTFDDSYLTIRVFDTQTRALLPVITIREEDPASGRSVTLGWSPDSKALVIRGAGALWREENRTICFVYLPVERALLEDPSCETATR